MRNWRPLPMGTTRLMCARDGCDVPVRATPALSEAERAALLRSLRTIPPAPKPAAEAAPVTYPARKAAERGKSYARQVWETVAVIGLMIGFSVLFAWLMRGSC